MTYLRFPLKLAQKLYANLTQTESHFGRNWKFFANKEYSNNLIYEVLVKDEACMISRLGAVELNSILNHIGVKQQNAKWLDYITGTSLSWWWEPGIIKQLQVNAGFFPPEVDKIEKFCELMLKDISEVDILGSWLKEESFFKNELVNAKRVVLEDLEPFFTPHPWTKALKDKKVLVVHPFAETIERQYKKRKLLFENDLLPEFELKTIKAVQSVAGNETPFPDWFAALDFMKKQIDDSDYEICIIGCGAYGLPLAAHVKRRGKKAVHLAGATQLLFGIKGKRWEEFIVWPYANLFNEHWVRPGEGERPKNASVVEGACYW